MFCLNELVGNENNESVEILRLYIRFGCNLMKSLKNTSKKYRKEINYNLATNIGQIPTMHSAPVHSTESRKNSSLYSVNWMHFHYAR